ncbi:hypothetical protein JG688_00006956 [Phytophthora aleatoria]|uniref:Ribosome biogenesis protein NOP53 n=1 Tax=Phytophthora aleatoria TaxID=2496075 RepID=A0A8J5IMJ7_9STRA|nr:hypothetical protein JG688_00006956 [Phytophthora aleatoria]
MGSSKRRRQQRVKVVGAQVEESIRQDAEDKKLKHVATEQLFQVDSKGGDVLAPLTKKQKLEKLQKDPLLASTRKFDASKAHKGESLAVKKLQQNPQSEQQKPKKTNKVKDLWGQDGSVKDDEQNQQLDEYVAPVVVKKTKRRKLLSSTKYNVPTVEVAAAGQSYHPDFDSHQDVMAEAVAKELEKREKKAQLQEPVTKGMSEETLQYIKQDSEEESSDSEDDEDSDRKTLKRPEKVTRAQRNKRSRHKQMELEHQMRRGEKAIIKQINASQHILQDIVKSEKEATKKQEVKKLQQEQKLEEEPLVRVAGKYTKLERETPVSFSEELTGNMRTLKPKGNPLLDRFDSLHKRNQFVIGRPKKTRKAKVVEIRREEYERTKRSILNKIRRRLVILGVIIGLLSVVAFILGGVIHGYYSNILKFHRVSGHVTLANLYFIYAAVSLTFSLHGFYIDGKWRKLQQDGNHLIMHVRTFFILGVGSWALALWLGIATLSAFGLVEVQYIASSNANLIYLTTLIMITVHLVTSPWLLRTIHRKGSQADEFFGAEFLSDIRRPRKQNGDYGDEASSSDEDEKDVRAAVQPLQLAMEGDDDEAPRSARRQPSARSASPRISSTATHAVVESRSVEPPGYHQIPFASPVFVMNPDANLPASDFWQLWKQTETTGAFSCTFANQPSRADLEQHLGAHGFHVVAAEQKDSVLQVYFYGSQYGTDTFLCEFVLLFARRFFQATFKCKERETASDFVTRFNLQDLLVVEGE